MKVFYSLNSPELNGYVHVSNSNTFNMLVDDNEADEIIVDDMLGKVPFEDLPKFFESLMAKLRISGRLVIYFTDFDLVSMQYDKGVLGIQQVSQLLKDNASVLNEEVIKSLINGRLRIDKRDYNANYQGIIVGAREA